VSGFQREETAGDRSSDFGRAAAGAELAQNEGPRERSGASELQWLRPPQSWGVAAAEDEACFVKPAPTRPPNHLQELVRLDLVFQRLNR